jgi:hypothetical protein
MVDTCKKTAKEKDFRYGESNPGLAGLMLFMRAADASHYTITDDVSYQPTCTCKLSPESLGNLPDLE